MFTHSPATKSAEIFDELALLFQSPDQYPVDGLVLANLRRSADALMNADKAEAHIAYSAVAALNWDTETAKAHIEKALSAETSVMMHMNATVTFEFLNRSDLAVEHALSALKMAPNNVEVVNRAISALMSSGDVSAAANLQKRLLAADEQAETELDALSAHETLQGLGISESSLKDHLLAARDVLTAAKKRTRHIAFDNESEPDGELSMAFELGFFGSLEEEFLLEEKLSEKLGDLDDWNPNKLSVCFKYLVAHHGN